MILILGNGPSIKEIRKDRLAKLAEQCFTIVCNGGNGLPFDVSVSLDPWYVKDNKEVLKVNKKAVITRPWDYLFNSRINAITVSMDSINTYKLSGVLSAVIGDRLARATGDKAYILGLDHVVDGKGGSFDYTKDIDYASFGLDIINLSKNPTITAWPTIDKPPTPKSIEKSQYLKLLKEICAKI